MKTINLLLDPEYKYIAKVETGSSENKIAISLKNKVENSEVFFLTWDIDKNEEIQSFEVSDKAKTMFDAKGDIYLIEDGKVYLTDQNVCLTCF